MEKFLFENVDGVVDKLLEEWDKLEEKKNEDYTISVVSHYNIMKDIINYLVKNTSFMLCDIELEEPNYRNYYDEYILTIDSNLEIWCQKAKLDNGKYVRVEDSVTFVHSDVNSKFVVINKDECLIEFDFGTEEETECSCNECCDCCECEGKCKMCNKQCSENAFYLCPSDCDHKQCSGCPHIPSDSNTSVSTYGISEYYINGKPVDKETFVEYQADYDKYFQSAMSEMSKFLKLLNW